MNRRPPVLQLSKAPHCLPAVQSPPRISLCAFFTWASREFDLPSPMKAVPSPKFEGQPIEPFTKEEVEALLKACESSQEVQPANRRKFTMRRSTAKHDQAIMTLLDTGLRASELCALKIGDVDLKTGKVQVKHGRLGGAKGGKGCTVFLGKANLIATDRRRWSAPNIAHWRVKRHRSRWCC
jgi:integrase/recombinase XerD